MVHLDGSSLTLDQLIAIADRGEPAQLTVAAARRVEASRAVVDRKADGDEPAYGINTGFGALAETAIPRDALGTLQVNLLRSHAAGVAEPLPVRAVRAAMALRANVLAKGYSGIRLATLEHLLQMLNRGVHPVVPSRGSVGASGDLAPLAAPGAGAHRRGTRDGRERTGRTRRPRGPGGRRPRVDRARAEGRSRPHQRHPAVHRPDGSDARTAPTVARAADIAAAMSIDALRGSVHPFDARIHDARPHQGQSASARNIRTLLAGSAINRSHADCGRVQDAYSLRCAAQVHGAARDALRFVRDTVLIEANAATDNPMVFAEADEIVSGGNFHGAPIAVAADLAALALAQLATISERRARRWSPASGSRCAPGSAVPASATSSRS